MAATNIPSGDQLDLLASKLSAGLRAALIAICQKAPDRARPEWFRIERKEYDALRRRKLIGGVYSLRDRELQHASSPNRLCHALPLGHAIVDHISEGKR